MRLNGLDSNITNRCQQFARSFGAYLDDNFLKCVLGNDSLFYIYVSDRINKNKIEFDPTEYKTYVYDTLSLFSFFK